MAVRAGGEEGSPPKFPLLFRKASPWKPCIKHHLKGRLIIFSGLRLLVHSSSSSTGAHHGHVNGSGWPHGRRSGRSLISGYAHWHPQGLVHVPAAGRPGLGNCSGPVGHSAGHCHSLWAQRDCLPVTRKVHLSSPTEPTLPALPALPALPSPGLPLVPLLTQEEG